MANPVSPESKNCPASNLGIMKLNDHKAGMQGIDTGKINQIIEQASKGSKFYQHKQKNQEKINVKIADMKAACARLTEEQKKCARAKVSYHLFCCPKNSMLIFYVQS